MNLKSSKLLLLISFLPVWAIRSNLTYIEIFISIIVFVFIPYSIFHFLFREKYYLQKKNIYIFVISMIIIYGIDNHLGLKNPIIGWNVDTGRSIIRSSIIIPAATFFLFLIIKFSNFKFAKIFFVFIAVVFIFNVFDQTKSSKKIVNFQNEKNNNFSKTVVIIIFDEMSGINSYESLNYNGNEFLKFSEKFFKKYNFNTYPNAEVLDSGTIASIPNMLNFSVTPGDKKNTYYIDDLKNYFQNHIIIKNLLFDKFNSISVYQNMSINYCYHNNVSNCDTFNPFDQNNFVEGYKDNPFSKIFTAYEINGSILGFVFTRILKRLRLIDILTEPIGEKITLPNILNKIEKDIYSEKFDLIFSHILVPHTPYGYDKNCLYNGKLSAFSSLMTKEDKIIQHNIERICVLKFLDTVLQKIKNNKKINDLDIIITSDHGSKIEGTNFFSAILANRNNNTKYKNINDKTTIPEFLIKKFDK